MWEKARHYQHLIWHTTCCCIWQHRNRNVIQHDTPDILTEVTHIQQLSWILFKSILALFLLQYTYHIGLIIP